MVTLQPSTLKANDIVIVLWSFDDDILAHESDDGVRTTHIYGNSLSDYEIMHFLQTRLDRAKSVRNITIHNITR